MDPITPRHHPVIACWRGPESQAAVEYAATMAVALGQPLMLASAYDYEPVSMSSRIVPTEASQASYERAAEGLELARFIAGPGLDISEHTLAADDPALALDSFARSVDASLLVVGRDEYGSVTRSIVQHASCPVAVVPANETTTTREAPKRIGVAYDDSTGARNAVRAGRFLAATTEGRVSLLCVGAALGPWPTLVESGVALGVDLDTRTLHGDVAPSLLQAAEDLDLLVCGTHARGRLRAAVLGSTSAELLKSCPCPLLVVPTHVHRRAGTPFGITTAGA